MSNSAFRIPCIGDILDYEFTPRGDLVAPWLKEGESALIYAAPGVGKSMFALSLALAVAGGGKYLDWEAPRPYRVLFVDGEMPMDTIKERTELLLKALPDIDHELIRQNLHVFARAVSGRIGDLPQPGDHRRTGRVGEPGRGL